MFYVKYNKAWKSYDGDGTYKGNVAELPPNADVYDSIDQGIAASALNANTPATPVSNDWVVSNGVATNKKTGETLTVTYDNTAGGKAGTTAHLDQLIQDYLNTGVRPNQNGYNFGSNASWKNFNADIDAFIKNNPRSVDTFDSNTLEDTEETIVDPQEAAKNAYYNDLYSLKEGTEGKLMLDTLERGYRKQADNERTLAEVAFQRSALNQAKTVKQITDQVRAERMARLRSGMSASQLANQDMQMLIANMNALNEKTAELNQGRLAANMNRNMAQDNAYNAYLEKADTRGQVAAAMSASDAGNSYWNTIQNMRTLHGSDPSKWTSKQWQDTLKLVTGQQTPTE